jgi:hypothetical protein
MNKLFHGHVRVARACPLVLDQTNKGILDGVDVYMAPIVRQENTARMLFFASP